MHNINYILKVVGRIVIMDDLFDKIKEHAIKAKDEATKITKHMVGKTSDVINKTKTSIAISEAESKIKDLYASIGKKVYEDYAKCGETEEVYSEACNKIDLLLEEVNELREKIAQMQDTKICDCGEYSKKDSMYCAKCGRKFYDAHNTSDTDEETVIITPLKDNE